MNTLEQDLVELKEELNELKEKYLATKDNDVYDRTKFECYGLAFKKVNNLIDWHGIKEK